MYIISLDCLHLTAGFEIAFIFLLQMKIQSLREFKVSVSSMINNLKSQLQTNNTLLSKLPL